MTNPIGRPTKYNTETIDACIEYLKTHKELGDPVPIAAGLSLHLGVTKSTLYEWAKKYPEFSDMLEDLNSSQERIVVAKSIENLFNPTISKLMLAKQGYSDKQETDITSGGEKIQPVMVKFMEGEDE